MNSDAFVLLHFFLPILIKTLPYKRGRQFEVDLPDAFVGLPESVRFTLGINHGSSAVISMPTASGENRSVA